MRMTRRYRNRLSAGGRQPAWPVQDFVRGRIRAHGWVYWYNNARLHSQLNYLTPAEYEAAYYSQQSPRRPRWADTEAGP
ncbi:IS3 family transposase [Nocardia jiangxiensis]|uniref:IS3 family transposase n=1 Tax=Nocardia jiangxiensis TaxID=282685 RepID=UPI00146E9429